MHPDSFSSVHSDAQPDSSGPVIGLDLGLSTSNASPAQL